MKGLEISVVNSAKLQKQIVSLYDAELAEISASDTRTVLANIMYNRDMSEVNSIRIAYYLSTITDEMGKAEGFRNAVEMIMHVTGLKKSMVSNYVRVAKHFFWDDHKEFFVPDCLAGFTITQLVEGLDKVGSTDFMRDIMEGKITQDMSAKKIRDFYKEQENTVDTTATESTESTESIESTESTESTESKEKKSDPKDNDVFPVYELVDTTGQVVGMASINKDYDKDVLNKYLKTLTLGKKVG